MPDKSILSRNIEALWRESGLSQAEFGARFNSNNKSVWAYINGKNIKPSADFLFELCNYYQIDIEFLKSRLVKLKGGKVSNYTAQKDKADLILSSIKLIREIQEDSNSKIQAQLDILEKLTKSLPRNKRQ